MSNRERWVIYPLLMLALGASLRSKFTGQLNVDRVICDALVVGERNSPARIVLASSKARPAYSEILGPESLPVALLESDSTGTSGLLHLSAGKRMSTTFGLTPDGSIISATFRQGTKVYRLPVYRLPSAGAKTPAKADMKKGSASGPKTTKDTKDRLEKGETKAKKPGN